MFFFSLSKVGFFYYESLVIGGMNGRNLLLLSQFWSRDIDCATLMSCLQEKGSRHEFVLINIKPQPSENCRASSETDLATSLFKPPSLSPFIPSSGTLCSSRPVPWLVAAQCLFITVTPSTKLEFLQGHQRFRFFTPHFNILSGNSTL